MFRSTLAVLAVLLVDASVQAASIAITLTAQPTPGLATHQTWTVHASSNFPMQGFDFAGDGSNGGPVSRGFYGSMNQLNPFGLPTIYSDNNGVIAALGGSPLQDSQFKVASSTVTVPPGFSEESGTILQGIWSHPTPQGLEYDIAQIVIPIAGAGSFEYRGRISTIEGSQVIGNDVSGGICLACYPPQITDVLIDNVNAAVPGFVSRTISANPFGTFSDFRFDSYVPASGATGTGPATPATFDEPTCAFNWNTIGSPLGTYKWLVTATNTYGFDDGSITVRITAVPEPATLGLFVLAVFGTLAVRRGTPSL